MTDSNPQLGPIYCGGAYFGGAPFSDDFSKYVPNLPYPRSIYDNEILKVDIITDKLKADIK